MSASERLRWLLGEMEHPIRAGNVLAPVRELCAVYPTVGRPRRREILANLHALLGRHGPGMGEAERRRAREAIEALPRETGLEADRDRLLSSLEGEALPPPPALPGHANLLLASTQLYGRTFFGSLQTLEVRLERNDKGSGVEHHLLAQADDARVMAAFHVGAVVAQEFLIRNGADRGWVNTFRLVGRFPELREEKLQGTSLGLGAALASLSSYLEELLPAEWAFVGEMEPCGRLRRVDRELLMAKLEVASDKGLSVVILPRACFPVPRASGRIPKLLPAADFPEAADRAFGKKRLAAALARLVSQSRREKLRIGFGPEMGEVPKDAVRILLTWVGRSDPFGGWLDREREVIRQVNNEEGPILTLCRELSPDWVYLFHTVQRGDNDFSDKAEQVKRLLESGLGPRVQMVPMKSVANPTDYRQLLTAYRRQEEAIRKRHSPPEVFFLVNTTTGTPQMHATFLLMWLQGRLNGLFFQVLEGRFARRRGVPRVHQVALPGLE